ncbi:hypothetical protein F4604DRAFT_1880988 [Suillus subluteus]|nr:hypothetical protein F4604DRAFT_1880988 [Suillus subluteus]
MLNRLLCTYPGCPCTFQGQRGRTKHIRTVHGSISSVNAESDQASPPKEYIPVASDFVYDGFEGGFEEGFDNFEPFNPEHQPGQPNIITHPHLRAPDDWSPFTDQAQFLLADFLFRKVEMLGPNIDFLMELWAFKAMKYEEDSPFKSHRDVYATIDTIQAGDVPWQCFTVSPQEDLPSNAPTWKQHEYQVWYRDPDAVIKNMLDNPDFDGQFDYTPYIQYDKDGQCQWMNFMSSNYAWRKSDEIHAEDHDSSDGAMYCGIILGSHIEYHPLYLSIGTPHNSIHHAHRNAVTPIGFLAIPKCKSETHHIDGYDNDIEFRKFKRQLFHSSLAAILQSLWQGMTAPVVRHCPDGHYHRVIYDLGAFIADYLEQVMLAGIVQNWCTKCTALPKDLDHSPAKHCTCEYTNILVESLTSTQLWDQYGIDDDIVPFTNDFPHADIHKMLAPDLLHQVINGCFKDHLVTWTCEIAAAPSFPGLHCFPHGRCFKQWMGDDSKALMKVYIPTIVDYVPAELVQCMSAFLDFCYLTLRDIKLALQRFHETWEIFRDSGVCPNRFSLPRQHSLEFGAPNGLCLSITESHHITAVEWPWRRSNRFEALGQMLLTNQRLDKSSERGYPWNLPDLTAHVHEPNLELLTQQFLFNQLHMADDLIALEAVEDDLPAIQSNISVFHSAIATFSAPSDVSSTHGMHCKIIHLTPSWRRQGMIVGRVKVFFSFVHNGVTYPCALVDHFSRMGRGWDTITGMWKVKPEVLVTGRQQIRIQSIEHIDTIYQAAHLLPVFGNGPLPVDFHFAHSLDAFNSYYVNKYADHHANEIVF